MEICSLAASAVPGGACGGWGSWGTPCTSGSLLLLSLSREVGTGAGAIAGRGQAGCGCWHLALPLWFCGSCCLPLKLLC